MLSSETKRLIDEARDYLVGVVPNPLNQIEQITYALIYKFMHDMDKASIKVGGEASFFTGGLKKYSWDKLIDSRLGNHDKYSLYSEALEKFTEAKQLPELFRSIYKSAFLPYKAPETLGMFLKVMNKFDYNHPEDLGNAYEYLLSIMSSQGDAGQFRTPRHIIKFMVDVLDPKKNEKILDPACGTGGFLIYSYRHIVEQHDGKDDPKGKEKQLTPDERKKLMQNLEGYDIDPSMVRMSQVNMYLHQFKNPQIFQYDTLTSEDRWGDRFDLILANPPFMSPRGGIVPHNKFSVRSNRAEVLFVDYIMNHLRPKGRAGIIVPEGIVFQSGNAYKTLRKNLIENGLYAVVSLPGGVFQPYSGVKTSILLIDNEVAKQKSEIAFVKVSADGYDLGAAKRQVSQNDLPLAFESLKAWTNGKSIDSSILTSVSKEKIAEKGDYNLSGERYVIATDYAQSRWNLMSLESITSVISNGMTYKNDKSSGGIPISRIQTISHGVINYELVGYADIDSVESKYLLQPGDILFSHINSIDHLGKVAIYNSNMKPLIHGMNLLRITADTERVKSEYLFYLLRSSMLREKIRAYAKQAVNQASISIKDLKTIELPVPPLEVQEQIVAELDGYAAIISGAKQIVDNWKPRIDVDPEWPRVTLKDVCELMNGRAYSQDELLAQGKYRVLRVGNFFSNSSWYYSDLELDKNKYCEKGDLLYAWSASFGARIWEEERVIYHYHIWKVLNDESRVTRPFLKVLLEQLTDEFKAQGGRGGTMMHLTKSGMESTFVPIPGLEEQGEIVKAIEREQKLVEESKKLISIYESKTQAIIGKLWSK